MRSLPALLLVLLFVAVGAVSWAFQLRPRLEVDAAPLAALPANLDSWRGVDVPLEHNVESMLRADYNVQRIYVHATGAAVSMYVGYYGTERGGRPEHTPEVCYESQGWEVTARRVLEVAGGTPFQVNEYLVEQQGVRHLVHFWFRSHRRTGLLGGIDQVLDRLLGRLFDGRADGSLVRISMPVGPGDELVARTILLQFASELDAQLAAHWPLETPGGNKIANPVATSAGGRGTHPYRQLMRPPAFQAADSLQFDVESNVSWGEEEPRRTDGVIGCAAYSRSLAASAVADFGHRDRRLALRRSARDSRLAPSRRVGLAG
jgi:EpsI family protein